jgi:hypothetical protein
VDKKYPTQRDKQNIRLFDGDLIFLLLFVSRQKVKNAGGKKIQLFTYSTYSPMKISSTEAMVEFGKQLAKEYKILLLQ